VAGARPVLFSEPLVDVGVLAAARLGIALPIVNWAGAPVTALVLTLRFGSRTRCSPPAAAWLSGATAAGRRGRSSWTWPMP
jgi:hypothetical protein